MTWASLKSLRSSIGSPLFEVSFLRSFEAEYFLLPENRISVIRGRPCTT